MDSRSESTQIQDSNPANGSNNYIPLTHTQFMDAGGTEYEVALIQVISSYSPWYPVTLVIQQFQNGQLPNAHYSQYVPGTLDIYEYMCAARELLYKHIVTKSHNGYNLFNGTTTKATYDIKAHVDIINKTITYDTENNIQPITADQLATNSNDWVDLMNLSSLLLDIIQKHSVQSYMEIQSDKAAQMQIDDLTQYIETLKKEEQLTQLQINMYDYSADKIKDEMQIYNQRSKDLREEARKRGYLSFAANSNTGNQVLDDECMKIKQDNHYNNIQLKSLKSIKNAKLDVTRKSEMKQYSEDKLALIRLRIGEVNTIKCNKFNSYLLKLINDKIESLRAVLREGNFYKVKRSNFVVISCKSTCKYNIEIAKCELQLSYCGNPHINSLITILQLCTSVCSMTVAGPLLGYFLGLRLDETEIRETNGTFLNGNVFSKPAVDLIIKMLKEHEDSELIYQDMHNIEEPEQITENTDIILINTIAHMVSSNSANITVKLYEHYQIQIEDDHIDIRDLVNNPIIYQRYDPNGIPIYVQTDKIHTYIQNKLPGSNNYIGANLHIPDITQVYNNNKHAFAVPVLFPASDHKKLLDLMIQDEYSKHPDIGHIGLDKLSKDLDELIVESTKTMCHLRDSNPVKYSQWNYGGLQRFITRKTIQRYIDISNSIAVEHTRRLFAILTAAVSLDLKQESHSNIRDMLIGHGINLRHVSDKNIRSYIQQAFDTMDDPIKVLTDYGQFDQGDTITKESGVRYMCKLCNKYKDSNHFKRQRCHKSINI